MSWGAGEACCRDFAAYSMPIVSVVKQTISKKAIY
jgi:hypothetical protein